MPQQIIKMGDAHYVVVDEDLNIIHEERDGVRLSTDTSGHQHDEKGQFTGGGGSQQYHHKALHYKEFSTKDEMNAKAKDHHKALVEEGFVKEETSSANTKATKMGRSAAYGGSATGSLTTYKHSDGRVATMKKQSRKYADNGHSVTVRVDKP